MEISECFKRTQKLKNHPSICWETKGGTDTAWPAWLASSLEEKHWGLLLDIKLNVGQRCTLAVLETSCIPGCMSTIIINRSREKFFLFSPAPETTSKGLWPIWPPSTREILINWREMQQRPKNGEAGPNPNTATFAYRGKEKAEGQPNHSLQLPKAGL